MRPDLSVYLVTDTVQCGERGVVETVRRAVAGGVTCVQVRDKRATHGELVDLVRAVADAVADRATVLVDDHPEVVLCARSEGATVHGVHVGQSDRPPEATRELLGPDAVVGLTAHTPQQLAAAAALPAGTVDYLGVGAVAATASKADHPPVLGVDGFARLAAAAASPCVAIGGVDVTLVRPLREAGAAGVAVVSAVCAATDPERAAADLAREWGR
ncbi:thiamine phosphate synthase [Nocardioides aequoreus]|uniref:thiamine phosphate synthase n=1 Tax=Nocardioides aequoreus TaxID=397278 RepID=UPI0004C3D4C1|nr:thiamine phosphate synthase [Nocardioides aequoreus]